ncbi:MAG: PQQ-dependent sugar dehydrogenase, partial [Methyloceanibacter sp.]
MAWWQCAALAVFAATLALSSTVGSAADRVIDTETGKIKVQTLATGLKRPWGLAFLPDGRMLVTERAGNLRIMATDGTLSEPLTGVPKVEVIGQGGLLDVTLDPEFKSNKLVYISYSEAGDDGAGTAVARG